MSSKSITILAGAILAIIVACVAGLGLVGGGLAMAACAAPMPAGATTSSPTRGPTRPPSPPDDARAAGGTWTGDQRANATVIVAVGQRLRMPARAWVIAVATAMQESRLHNLNDRGADNNLDSLGLFQQRPSQGWGTPEQIRDPAHAATQFYQHLEQVTNWPNLPLTVAAQAVQHSAHPDAYATWEDDALALVEQVGPTLTGMAAADFTQWLNTCSALGGDGQPDSDTVPLPADFMLPPNTPPAVTTAIDWALAQLGTPYTFGGDCTAAHSGIAVHQCDCSSLTMMAYRAAGITIPRTAARQYHTGTPVTSLGELLPGDLLFIPGSDGTTTAPGHVGMYLGDGLLIQAPHTGDHVKITKLVQWQAHLVGARRVTE